MARTILGGRAIVGLLVAGAVTFYFIQMWVQTVADHKYASLTTTAVESREDCQDEMWKLGEKSLKQQKKLSYLEEEKARLVMENQKLARDLEIFQNEMQLEKDSHSSNLDPTAAVVIIARDRGEHLERTLDSVTKYLTHVAREFPLFVSQDGPNEDVMYTARGFSEVHYLQYLDDSPPKTKEPWELIADYRTASHYKWTLTQLFSKRGFRRVIVLEDDLEISPDFFSYFEATAPLLDKDKTLLAISSWNDNGQDQFVSDPEELYRSDFFPGRGWMLSKSTWDELAPNWPDAYWDDWLRLGETRKGRQFIRPEVCRTYKFGEEGSSFRQFYEQYLKPIRLNNVSVDWKSKDLAHMESTRFEAEFGALVAKARRVPASLAIQNANEIGGEDIRVHYSSLTEFQLLAEQFGISQDSKDGVPRTAYKGVVVFRWKGTKRVFLAPPNIF